MCPRPSANVSSTGPGAIRKPFNELLQYFAMERFLYRLSQSVHADRFVLKGALMLRVWRSPELRPTMDIDLEGHVTLQLVSLSRSGIL